MFYTIYVVFKFILITNIYTLFIHILYIIVHIYNRNRQKNFSYYILNIYFSFIVNGIESIFGFFFSNYKWNSPLNLLPEILKMP